jgi:hypothetical protein
MCSSIVPEGCRKAELHRSCSMLVVEAKEGAELLLLLAACWSARSAAERRLVGCRRPHCRGTSETPRSRNTTAV